MNFLDIYYGIHVLIGLVVGNILTASLRHVSQRNIPFMQALEIRVGCILVAVLVGLLNMRQ